jgi:electron transport complex protein RnfD
MRRVLLSCVPVGIGAVYFYGLRAALLLGVSVGAAVAAEATWQLVRRSRPTLHDGSAAVTGVLLALTLPPSAPLWGAAVGAVFAVTVAKQLFGGLGRNVFNPALLARGLLLVSWPGLFVIDGDSPLGLWKNSAAMATAYNAAPSVIAQARYTLEFLCSPAFLWSSFWGNAASLLGDCSGALLLVGALYLLGGRWLKWRIPVAFLGTFLLGVTLVARAPGAGPWEIPFHLLQGGVLLAAFFLAADPVSSPLHPAGQLLFGIGSGLLCVVFRYVGPHPEGFTFSILAMNALTPLIDRLPIWGRQRDAT